MGHMRPPKKIIHCVVEIWMTNIIAPVKKVAPQGVATSNPKFSGIVTLSVIDF
jgi:hypothetical protein